MILSIAGLGPFRFDLGLNLMGRVTCTRLLILSIFQSELSIATLHYNSGFTENKTPRWSLNGMTALVTGGTRGIGYATVEELAGFGAKVHTCSRNEEELNKCLSEWKAKGYVVTGSVCDASYRQQRETLMGDVSSVFNGKLNILVNNVGTNIRKRTCDYSVEEYSKLMSTNFESSYHMCQLAHPLLKASGVGSIVFIASKGAINQLTKNLACEWAADNIRTNSVSPWYIRTSLVECLLENKEFVDKIVSRTPFERVGEPEEVAPWWLSFACRQLLI